MESKLNNIGNHAEPAEVITKELPRFFKNSATQIKNLPKAKVADIDSLTKICKPQKSRRIRHNSPKDSLNVL